MDMKLEFVVLPVADVGRAKDFYAALGWREDADIGEGAGRVVQMTPPRSDCSIMLGPSLTTAAPGSAHGLYLVVDDVEAARAELAGRGVPVSEVFHQAGGGLPLANGEGRAPGLAPERASYFSFASFSDPDGNVWFLQEVTTRFPGRLW
jgi:catechol 2,3-dioxygenase-like lactoylglutathione lyase family enzyme